MLSHILHLCSWIWQLDAAIYTTLLGLQTMQTLRFLQECFCVSQTTYTLSFRFYEINCIKCELYKNDFLTISKQIVFFVRFL